MFAFFTSILSVRIVDPVIDVIDTEKLNISLLFSESETFVK